MATQPLALPETIQQQLATWAQQAAAAAAPNTFHLVIVPEADPPTVTTFEELQALTEAIRPWLGQPAYLYVFMGQRLKISAGPLHFLQTPSGPVPLFAVPGADAVEFPDDGFTGITPDPLPGPADPGPVNENGPPPERDPDDNAVGPAS